MAGDVCEVLVVGGGPTGLTLACVLARNGIDVRIIDAATEPPKGSRGKGLQPRSLEVFDDLGIVDTILSNGRLAMPMRTFNEGVEVAATVPAKEIPPHPDKPYLASLITPQWRVEEALRAKLEQLSHHVEFGTELTGFEQDADGVTAHVKTAGSEAPVTIRAQWLVGCDGGKSTVRHMTNISFAGETLEQYRMLVADVRATAVDREHWHTWRVDEGFLALCPLPSTDQFQFQASIAPDQNADVSLERFQSLIESRAPGNGIQLSDATWMSLWRANVRMVDRYREGRVFLAGDAAHVHSPAGGQGMNTGIQDGYNLGWKLAAVLRGAPAELLDTYQEERLPIAAGVIGLSNQLMASVLASRAINIPRTSRTLQLDLNYRDSRLSRECRSEEGRPSTAPLSDNAGLSGNAGPSASAGLSSKAGLSGGTAGLSDTAGLRAGDRAPEAPDLIGPVGAVRVFDLLRGPHVTLLGFGARWQTLIENSMSAHRGVKGFVVVSQQGSSSHYFDSSGLARGAYADDTLFVVRPDNYIGMVTQASDEAAVSAYLQAICPGSCP